MQIQAVVIATSTRGSGVYRSLQGISVDYDRTKEFVVFCVATVQVKEEDSHWNEQADNCLEERAIESSWEGGGEGGGERGREGRREGGR